MSAPRITAAQEFAWLTNREEHRAPIDAFFDSAAETVKRDLTPERAISILELGPGPQMDLRDRFNFPGVRHYEMADTRPASEAVMPLEPLWSDDQRLPYRDGAFSVLLAREVFEHVFHLTRMIEECHRVLGVGGTMYFTTPYAFPLHDYEDELGGDYIRMSPKAWVMTLQEAGFTYFKTELARELFGSWQMPVSIMMTARK